MLQTLPPFVYLIPLIFLFSITEPKLYGIAIILYAIVPVIRLTDLGIRLVDKEVIEAADAFGMTDRQKLFGVQIPLALPNIMAGVNQTIMMSLAMVVIASLVSAPGLGVLVLRGIRNLELGVGLVAGIGIVLLAVILDRVTKAALARVNAAASVHAESLIGDTGDGTKSVKHFHPQPLQDLRPRPAAERAGAGSRSGMGKRRTDGGSTAMCWDCSDINVDMRAGDITVIMGLSGSGKSTLDPPSQPPHRADCRRDPGGWRGCAGIPATTRLRELRRKQMSMVFQHFALLPHKHGTGKHRYGAARYAVNHRSDYEA
jgi:hypothetical protein